MHAEVGTEEIEERLAELERGGLTRRLRLVSGPQGPTILLVGQPVLLRGSHNSPGLAGRPPGGGRRPRGRREAAGGGVPGGAAFFAGGGDVAPLEEIVELAQGFGGPVAIAEAHGTGTFGPGGRGALARAGLEGEGDAIVG